MKRKKKIIDVKTQIEKYRKKVNSIFPKSFIQKVGNRFTIVQEQTDLTLKDVLAEMLILPQETEFKAWEMAQVSAKTTQNFNRTHPQRMDNASHDDKYNRIESRKQRGMGEGKRKKRDKLDSYYIYD